MSKMNQNKIDTEKLVAKISSIKHCMYFETNDISLFFNLNTAKQCSNWE